MKKNQFPSGWNETRVRRLIEHYENQSEEEAVAEDEATFDLPDQSHHARTNELTRESCCGTQ